MFWVVTALYGLANLYTFFKLSYFLDYGITAEILLGLAVLFLNLSPAFINLYSLRGSDRSARILAYTGYMWMGFLVVFFPSGILLEIYNFMVRYSEFSSMALSPASVFLIPFFVSVLANIYGYFEAKQLCVERLTIKTPKLPAGAGTLRIVQISDLHLGIIIRGETLEKVIDRTEKLDPHIVVSTGDLVDGVTMHIDYLADRLEKVKPPLGKFAIIGNHEFYGGLKNTLKFLDAAGFTVLEDRAVTLENMIQIAGVSYNPEGKKHREQNSSTVSGRELLSGLRHDIFTLLLKHTSDVEEGTTGLFDLQLSGHTHKGQMFPINLATMFIFRHHSGFTQLPEGSAIYVSRGAGTAGPPVRFLSKPEITLIEIIPEGKS
ncbi:MAG: metallophosphoesterase [Deferribacteres bacterium]|nr:metallophosphoesterase [Deferribacteres bacterium]